MNNRELAISLTTKKIKELKIKKLSSKFISEVAKYAYNTFRIRQDIITDILYERIAIEGINDELLYKFLVSWVNASQKLSMTYLSFNIDVDKWFTEIEKRDYIKPYKLKDIKSDIVIPSGGWHMTDMYPHRYITIHTDTNMVVEWRNNNIIRYNPETQRDLIKVQTEIGESYKLDLNIESVNKIKELMLSGEYFTVQGTLNLNPEHNDVDIKINNGDLIIPYEAKIDLIEGFHNYRALCSAKDENSNWNFPCEYRLCFLNTEQAGNYIAQMDKKNHFSKTQINRIDVTDPINIVINTLNTDNKNIFKGTIDENTRDFIASMLKKSDLSDIRKRLNFIDKITDGVNNYIRKNLDDRNYLNKYEWMVFVSIALINDTANFGDEINHIKKVLEFVEDNSRKIGSEVSDTIFKKINIFIKGAMNNV